MRYVLFLLELTWTKRFYLAGGMTNLYSFIQVRWNDHLVSYFSMMYCYLKVLFREYNFITKRITRNENIVSNKNTNRCRTGKTVFSSIEINKPPLSSVHSVL